MLDYIRIACAVPPVSVGDVKKNTEDICRLIADADAKGCDLVIFPELAITGYTCADLFFQQQLLDGAAEGLRQVAQHTRNYPHITAVVGVPAVIGGQMYNCGAVISDGIVRGLVPKTYLPNYREFYESRWFSSTRDLQQTEVSAQELGLRGTYTIPVGKDVLFRLGEGTLLGVEICEDLWTPIPPSTLQTLGGAQVVVNLSASNETVGKREYRRSLVQHQSSVCNCIYACVSAGYTESTQDLVFSGHSLISENGKLLAESQEGFQTDYLLVQDADLGKVRAERRKNKSARDTGTLYGKLDPMRTAPCNKGDLRSDGTLYPLRKFPFVPETDAQRREKCMSVFHIQATALAQRLKLLGANAVIGVSGGLDSTLALLVAVEAMRRLGRPASDVYGITMPCFGTSDRTYRNAQELMARLGITGREINVRDAVTAHLQQIGHDLKTCDVTYENAQARERTQVLMDFAGTVGGIVVGTGDMSELALGWCTYNGDHMSMYGVNASVPKTLIPHMIATIAETDGFAEAKDVLLDIVDTPISPELLPPDATGEIAQKTEDLVGPYALHDFFLYHMLRNEFTPKKIYALACRAFVGEYDQETVKHWLKEFCRRFFSQQFKRSCQPDGVKTGSVSLNPRGDWKMPSDASAKLWLQEMENL